MAQYLVLSFRQKWKFLPEYSLHIKFKFHSQTKPLIIFIFELPEMRREENRE